MNAQFHSDTEDHSLTDATLQFQFFNPKWHPSKKPFICPISVMASPKMAKLGTFNLGWAVAWAFSPGSGPRHYLLGTMAPPHTTSLVTSSLPASSSCGAPFIWKNILQCKSKSSTIYLQFRNQLFLQVLENKYFHGLCTGPAPFVPRTLGAHSAAHCFTCFLSHLQEGRLLRSGRNSCGSRIQPSLAQRGGMS